MGLKSSREDERNSLKEPRNILLLGTSESGKSTIFKLAKLFACDNHVLEMVSTNVASYCIYNAIWELDNVFRFCQTNRVALKHSSSIEAGKSLCELLDEHRHSVDTLMDNYSEKVLENMMRLWCDSAIRAQFHDFKTKSQIHSMDAVEWFLDHLDVMAPGFIPSRDDYLRYYCKTAGRNELRWFSDSENLVLWDVGGSRNERKKYKSYFHDLSGIIFVGCLACYDRVCWEDDITNRMKESLEYFEAYVNNQNIFLPIFIILTKADLLEKKLSAGITPQVAFPEYTGGTDYNNACEFIKDLYISKVSGDRERAKIVCVTSFNWDTMQETFRELREHISSYSKSISMLPR